MKKIAGGSERYRLLISDGMFSNSYAMLATQLNTLVTDNVIDEYSIITAKRINCNVMQGKKVIIILEAEVLRPGSQVGQKIGSPVPIAADGSVAENDMKMAKQAGKRSGDEDHKQEAPVAKKPLQQNNHQSYGASMYITHFGVLFFNSIFCSSFIWRHWDSVPNQLLDALPEQVDHQGQGHQQI